MASPKARTVAGALLMLLAMAACRQKKAGFRAAEESATELKPAILLGVTPVAQERTNWCWAASGQMVMSYLGVRVSQCQQAIRQFSRPGEAPLQCCDPDQCNWTGYPEYSKFGLNEKLETTPPLTWDRLRYQLSVLKNPVAFTWKWKWQSFEHMMVAVGYNETSDRTRWVYVRDPLGLQAEDPQPYAITYEAFAGGEGWDYVHGRDYIDVRPPVVAVGR